MERGLNLNLKVGRLGWGAGILEWDGEFFKF